LKNISYGNRQKKIDGKIASIVERMRGIHCLSDEKDDMAVLYNS